MDCSKAGPIFQRAFMSVAILVLISVIVFVFAGGRHVAMLAIPVALVGFVVLLASAFYGGSRHDRIDGDYARLPDHNRPVTFEIYANRIASRSDVSSDEVFWRGFTRAYRTLQGFLLYQTDGQMQWLPVSGFHDSADIERLAEILKSNVKEYSDVR